MHKFRIALSAAATAAMVFGTMGAASAQSTGQWESRADFIFQLDKQLGIQPVYPATPDFQDVSTANPYYGYIEAAYQAGITNGITQGVFGPTLALTRAEAAKYLVIAFGAGAEAQNVTSTSFADNSVIPTALVGYVGEAAQLGLLKGFPNGYFHPDSNLTVAQEGYLLHHLQTAMSSLSLKVSASAPDVAPGQIVTLASTGTAASGASVPAPIVSYSVTGTNAAQALVSGNSFVASAPGNYTVQATAGTATATTTIGVYGAATALKVSAPASVVANGQSQQSVTVDVVDANGNVVANSTDSITLQSSATSAAGFAGSPSLLASDTESAVNGVATFTLQSGTIAGSSTTLSASDAAGLTGSASVSTTAQVPTALSVTAAQPYIDANSTNGSDAIRATVLDQTGNPMLSGAYTVSFSATGPANFAGSSTAAGVYYGPSQAPATATLSDVQGSAGAVTVTASANGLTAGTADITAVIAGAPAKIALSAAQTETSGTAATYTATVEDSHGYPVDWTGTVNLTDSDSAVALAPLSFTGQDSATFQVSDATAGQYTITAADAAGALTGGTTTLTVNAGSPVGVAVTPASALTLQVPVSSPSFTVSAQLVDGHQNPVAQSGAQVTFQLNSTLGNAGTATIGGQAGSVTETTNAQGVATATVQAQPYTGDSYTVSVTYDGSTTTTKAFKLSQNVAASSSLTIQDANSNVVSSLVSGNTYTGTVTLKDQYGNTVAPSDSLTLTLGGTGSAEINGSAVTGPVTITPTSGAYTFKVKPELAGSLTISIADASVYNAATQTSSYSVTPGSTVAAIGFTAGGSAANSATSYVAVPAGGEVQVTASATDAGGNAITAPSTIPVDLTATLAAGGSATGAYRLTASGADLTTNTVDVPAGQSSTTFYFVNSSAASENVYFGGAIDYKITNDGASSTYSQTAASTAVPMTFTFKDAAGQALSGVAVTFTLGTASGDGSLSTAAGVTNAQGQVTETFTTSSTWASGSSNTVTATVQGATSASGTQTVTVQY